MTFAPDLSFKFLEASQGFAAVAAGLGIVSGMWHLLREPAGKAGEWLSRFTFAAFVAGLVSSLAGIGLRWNEVNHFPVQTMFEALTTSAAALYLMFAIIYFVLGLQKTRGATRGLCDLFLGVVMAGEFALLVYTQFQEKGARMLPPALQSYWMSVHVPALLMSYMTMSIAYVACILFFTLKLVRQVFGGPMPKVAGASGLTVMSKAGIAAFLGFVFLVPFAQVVNIAIFVPVTLIGIVMAKKGKLDQLDAWISEFDKFSFAIFSIGFPFLTAGLWMGAFWAQEAWALYWGWDSKETSALISWLIYVVYLHLRFVAGWKGERGLWVIIAGAVSILITFQLFGYLPGSQDSMHKYTDGVSREGTELTSGQSDKAKGSGGSDNAVTQK